VGVICEWVGGWGGVSVWVWVWVCKYVGMDVWTSRHPGSGQPSL